MMTVTEANAVCVLFCYLGLHDWPGRDPTNAEALEAAKQLAESANKKLHAGVRGREVEERWHDFTGGE